VSVLPKLAGPDRNATDAADQVLGGAAQLGNAGPLEASIYVPQTSMAAGNATLAQLRSTWSTYA
jgi:hypothetical protein